MKWIPVNEKIPEEGQIVFCRNEHDICIGGWDWVVDDQWLWGQCYHPYWDYKKKQWDGDIESDDEYEVTHWMPMPGMEDEE